MTAKDVQQQPSTVQWEPTPKKLQLGLSKLSRRPEVMFYMLCKCREFVLSKHCVFKTENLSDAKVVRIILSPTEMLSFKTTSKPEEVSNFCSKLNMASSVNCRISVALSSDENYVIFTFIAPSETAEKKLFSLISLLE